MSLVFLLGLSSGVIGEALARAQGTIEVRVEGPGAGPHYVGQAVGVRLLVTAGAEEPTVELPEVRGAELILTGRDVRPVSAGSVGTVSHETNLYLFDVTIVPRSAGRLIVPAIRARTAEGSGAAGPIRFEAIAPPGFGKPAWFLGGIGPMEVDLVARPGAIRLGESVEISVELRGVGALGSTIRPRLRGTDGAAIEAEVSPSPTSLATEGGPPTRTFPFRVRPTGPGTLLLAPVLVAWFDPGTRQYQTISTRGLSIRIDDPPRFDPSLIEVASFEGESERGIRSFGRIGVGLCGGAILATLVAVGWWFVRSWERSPRWFAGRMARRLARQGGPDRAERVASAMAGYLARSTGRADGAITPPEAHEAIEAATGDAGLADRAARLIAECDAARYSGREGRTDRPDPMDEAIGFFRDLSRAPVERGGIDRSDREGGRHG